MLMPGRKYSAGTSYRYGFNGKENDNEVKGEGNQQDYGERIYDARVGRFLSVDPLTKNYTDLTPYQFASNTPLQATDLDGLEADFVNKKTGQRVTGPVYADDFPASQGWVANGAVMYKPKVTLPNFNTTSSLPRKEQEIMMSNGLGTTYIGPKSVVESNIAASRQNYYNAVVDNIVGGVFGAADYMLDPQGGGFKGAAMDGVLMSFGGIPAGEASVFPSLNKSTVIEPYRTDVEINLKPRPSVVIEIPRDRYPESAQHADEAAKSGVKPSGILNRSAAKQQRKQNLSGTSIVRRMDRDEFPPAVLTPTSGVSVKHINPSDNRGAGNFIKNQLRNVPDNTQVKIQTGVYKL
jgi:RHS repeat-associated protein